LVAAVATFHGVRPEYEFTEEQLRRERTPLQILWGERDPFRGLDVARRAFELTPNARLLEMNAGDNSCANCRSPSDVLGSSPIE
jgi:pimeloyl-ACP methyl ester carboxylesterase